MISKEDCVKAIVASIKPSLVKSINNFWASRDNKRKIALEDLKNPENWNVEDGISDGYTDKYKVLTAEFIPDRKQTGTWIACEIDVTPKQTKILDVDIWPED